MRKLNFTHIKANALFAFALFFVTLALSVSAFAQKEYSIAEIQGDKNASPHEGESVRTSGIVTAVTRTGFFLQTPDDKADGNPATSEGIFVFTKNAPLVTAGDVLTITGTVEEYRQRNDTSGPTVTEISLRLDQDTIKHISKGNALPKPIVLMAADFAANSIDQLEKFEGMRVTVAEMTVVAPTEGRVDLKNASSTSDGVFYGVVKGMNRPQREPGLDVFEFNGLDEKQRQKLKSDVPKIQIFDGNPEKLRVESASQLITRAVELDPKAAGMGITAGTRNQATPINVAAGMVLSNVTGLLHYASHANTIVLDRDPGPGLTSTIKPNPLPAPSERQFTVAGMNLENFFDDQGDQDIKEDVLTTDAFQRRLKKVSITIRDLMKSPDVIGVEEVENLSTLKRLAEKINADSVATGKPDPKYAAYLVEGNDGRGIDSGFLVKSSRVKVIETKQFGKDDKFESPVANDDVFLNDRPPLMLRASIEDSKTGKPFEFTVVVNHLKSFLGYSDPKQRDAVRLKKKLQAEFLAKWLESRQKADPQERIIVLGDFNFYQFNDGVMDVIGTINGKPAGKDTVQLASEDLVTHNLVDLVDSIDQKQRYSFVYDGNTQVLDHMLINEPLIKHVAGFGYLRVNADYPESYRNDDTRPERFSDHDPAVGYFSLDERQ